MKAVDAAKWAQENPHCTEDDIRALIPEYKAQLPRNAWIKTFRINLPPHLLERFSRLK